MMRMTTRQRMWGLGYTTMMRRWIWGAVVGLALATWFVACVPYGPVTSQIGPIYATSYDCSGSLNARCCYCGPTGACTGTCAVRSGWQAAIEGAACDGTTHQCDAILLEDGTYYADNDTAGHAGMVTLPSGYDTGHQIIIGRHGTALPYLFGGFECGNVSGNFDVNGLTIDGTEATNAIRCSRTTVTPVGGAVFEGIQVIGGLTDAVLLCGNIRGSATAAGVQLNGSLIDGGRTGSAVHAVCSDSSGQCADPGAADLPGACVYAPRVVIANNHITRATSYGFVPGPYAHDVNLTGCDDSTVERNTLNNNVQGNACARIGGAGVATVGDDLATVLFDRNDVDATTCSGEGLLINGRRPQAISPAGVLVYQNHFKGTPTDGVTLADYASADIRYNWFDGARFMAINDGNPATPSYVDQGLMRFAFNTTTAGAFAIGNAATGLVGPAYMEVQNNIWAGSALFVFTWGREFGAGAQTLPAFKVLAHNLTYNTTGDALQHCAQNISGVGPTPPWAACGVSAFPCLIDHNSGPCLVAGDSDPGLLTTDPQLGTGYHIAATSPALNASIGDDWLTQDLDGDAIPQSAPNAVPDRGCDEYHP